MKKPTIQKSPLGQHLLTSIKKALKCKEMGTVVRPKVNVSAVRKALGMTQKQFAQSYHINLETLKNWEQAKRTPDTTTLAYLTCIAGHPKEILGFLKQG
jgi:DNA-binding transcriptional regulator YiaG